MDKYTLTYHQQKVIDLMVDGHRLARNAHHFEINGMNVNKMTVRILMGLGLIMNDYTNELADYYKLT